MVEIETFLFIKVSKFVTLIGRTKKGEKQRRTIRRNDEQT